MTLSPEQKQAVTAWVAAGDSLAAIQKKLAEEFKVSLTYMDVRFLVDDLGLELKSAATLADADADLSKVRPASTDPAEKKGGLLGRLKKAVGARNDAPDEAEVPSEYEDSGQDLAGDSLGAGGAVKVELDRVVRPGAVASGSVVFSDGMSGKWALDQLGRLLLDLSRKGYQPSAADVQAFQRELSRLLQGPAF